MKVCRSLALLGSILLTISLLHAQQPQQPPPPKEEPPKTQPHAKGREAKRPPRQRVVTDLSGFDLLEPGKSQRKTMVVGATRGLPRPVALAPRLGKLYSPAPLFEWSYEGKAKDFVFILRDDAREEIFRSEVSGTRFPYPSGAPRLQPGKTYFWAVEPVSGVLGAVPSAPVGFLVVAQAQRDEIERDLAKVSSPDDYSRGLGRARVFTEHRLWYDTVSAYTDLIARHPDRAELYDERGMILAQLEVTKELAGQDLARAEELQHGGSPPKMP